MKTFIPTDIECIQKTGYGRWEDAAEFLHDVIEETQGMLLVLDEDAFILEWTAIEALCAHIEQQKFTHAGVPDGGLIHHRKHSFLHINPFMVFFNCDLIKPIRLNISRKEIDGSLYDLALERMKPCWINEGYTHDSIEPYAGLFYWLARVGNPLFLKAYTLWDGISTGVLDLQEQTICLHCWYSRSYDTDYVTRARIDAVYRTASKRKKPFNCSP
jgi:hypothetical protein